MSVLEGSRSAVLEPPAREDASSSELTPIRIINAALRRRALVFATIFVVALILVGMRWMAPPVYVSSAAFISQTQRPQAAVTGIAAQLGVQVPANEGLSSPQLYPELVKSRHFLRQVTESRFPLGGATDSGKTLIELYGISGSNSRLVTDEAIRTLNNDLDASAAPRTGIVTISATSTDPQLAHAIVQRVLQLIGKFNVELRQGGAAAERRFLEGRIAEERVELRNAEDQLQRFIAQNRDYSRSAELVFQHARLEREWMRHQALYAQMVQSYERAKMDEVRDTPVISLIAPPEVPVLPQPRGRLRALIQSLAIGLPLGIILVTLLEQFGSSRGRTTHEADELHRLTRSIRDDLRRGRILRVIGIGPQSVN